MYIDPSDMMERFGESELAEVAVPDSMAAVNGELMRAVILGEPTDNWTIDEVDAANAGLQVIDQSNSDAEELVNGIIGRRFPEPLNPVPGLLKRLVANISRYNLHDDGATDEIRQRYTDSIKTLNAVADGKMTLGLDTTPPTTGTGAPSATRSRSDRIFTRETLADAT